MAATFLILSLVFVFPMRAVSDLAKLTEQMKKALAKQVAIGKSFTSRDVLEFLQRQCGASHEQALEIGQQLIDSKLMLPLKSHVFEESEGRFKFPEAAMTASSSKASKLYSSIGKTKTIAELMSHGDFDPKAYAEDFLRRHSSDKIDTHCKKLVTQKVLQAL